MLNFNQMFGTAFLKLDMTGSNQTKFVRTRFSMMEYHELMILLNFEIFYFIELNFDFECMCVHPKMEHP